jgi:transposase
VFTIGFKNVTQTSKSMASSVHCESDADFFDCESVIHPEFLPCGQMMNEKCYLKVMKRPEEAVRRRRPDLWRGKNWLLHHDDVLAHSSLLIRDFLTKHETKLVLQPPYSPDSALADFFLFTMLKSILKGRRFESVEEIIENSLAELHSISKALFQECFQKWKKH